MGTLDSSWVKKQIAEDAPVPFDASDPDDGPYDDEAVDCFLTEANRVSSARPVEYMKIAKAS
jgi:hypothetical protein